MVQPRIHKSESVEDAVNMLDTRIPLLQWEITLIIQSLYDNAFREGAKQGRQAGIESANVLATDGTVQEYEEPTTTIRKRLEDKQRQLKDRAEFKHEDYAQRCLYTDD